MSELDIVHDEEESLASSVKDVAQQWIFKPSCKGNRFELTFDFKTKDTGQEEQLNVIRPPGTFVMRVSRKPVEQDDQ